MVNDRGELLNMILTPGNTDDRTPVPKLLQQLFGKVFADKGYVSQKLAKQLLKTAGIQLITKLKRNMKQRLMPLNDRLMRAQALDYRNHHRPVEEHLAGLSIHAIVLRSIALSIFLAD